MDITPDMNSILKDIYHQDTLLTTKVEKIDNRTFEIHFVFPKYLKTVAELKHVSMLQMQEAILEGLTCCGGWVLRENIFSVNFDYDSFKKEGANILLYKENITFKKLLQFNEPAFLEFHFNSVEEIQIKRNFYSFKIGLKGFIVGELECLIEKNAEK